ncbi:MAG: hypothetical protein JRJ02_14560 [Deltaproteobacteria bacterium]|nr:hypothetical protein [Deltaproteobacteria bacterium]
MKIESRPGVKDIEAWQPVESPSAVSSGPKGLQVERLSGEPNMDMKEIAK